MLQRGYVPTLVNCFKIFLSEIMSNLSEHKIFYAHLKVMWSISYILRSLAMNGLKMAETGASLSVECGHILLVDSYFILVLISMRELSGCRPIK